VNCIAKIKFLGRFKADVGFSSIDISIQGRTPIKSLLKELRQSYKTLSEVIDEDGTPRYDIMILINGVDINVVENLDELYIEDSDEILLVPITHGGSI